MVMDSEAFSGKNLPVSSNDEDPPISSTTALLSSIKQSSSSSSSSSSALLYRKPKATAVILTSLTITTCLSLIAAIAFAYLFFSLPPSPSPETSRPLKKLKHPVVLLVSSDGFRFGYQFKTPTPNIHRLIANGTEARHGLIPVFPSLTFPNHYSIATGLYPAYHGIISNHFLDPATGEAFSMQRHEPKWWLGEPLWETAVNHGLQAATYFWPGSEVVKGNWTCPKLYCQRYDSSVPFENRVDTVLSYFDHEEDVPSFMTLYFEDPDHQGHKVGPDGPRITEAVARIDTLIGRLISGLESKGVLEDVDIIMLGDHGMVSTCDEKLIFLEDLSPWVEVPKAWVQSFSPLLAIRPLRGVSPERVVEDMNKGLSSGKVKNGRYLKVYLKEDLPGRLHYADSDRIPPVIGLIGEGFKVELNRSRRQECAGSHGYDNAYFSMRSIFIAHGPHFARGRKVPSFENVQIYNLITRILKLPGASNNGSLEFPNTILLPSH